MSVKKLLLLTAATAFSASTAMAAMNATATTDLNLRAGPGPNYKIIGVIDGNTSATVNGCLPESEWCSVEYNGMQGWAYSPYLVVDTSGEQVVLFDNRAELEVETVTYDDSQQEGAAITLGAAGAMLGSAIVGGPAAIVVGALAGAAAGAAIAPEEKTITYVQANPVEPVFVRGEVVTGAVIPAEVTVYETPQEDLVYANLNGQYVIVTGDEREIVYVVR